MREAEQGHGELLCISEELSQCFNNTIKLRLHRAREMGVTLTHIVVGGASYACESGLEEASVS